MGGGGLSPSGVIGEGEGRSSPHYRVIGEEGGGGRL